MVQLIYFSHRFDRLAVVWNPNNNSLSMEVIYAK